jgi:hypothetical protein
MPQKRPKDSVKVLKNLVPRGIPGKKSKTISFFNKLSDWKAAITNKKSETHFQTHNFSFSTLMRLFLIKTAE